jgi:hypothetical protein
LQAKLARDAAHAEKENNRVVVARRREQHAAGLLLERVRTQMTDVYRPLTAAWAASRSSAHYVYMARELNFEWVWLTATNDCFMRPSTRLYPHLEICTQDHSPVFWTHFRDAGLACAWRKWNPGDL